MTYTRQPRAAAPAIIAAQVSLTHSGSGTMITLPGGARLYNIARATDDSFVPKPATLCTWSARPTYSDAAVRGVASDVGARSGGGRLSPPMPLRSNARRVAARTSSFHASSSSGPCSGCSRKGATSSMPSAITFSGAFLSLMQAATRPSSANVRCVRIAMCR